MKITIKGNGLDIEFEGEGAESEQFFEALPAVLKEGVAKGPRYKCKSETCPWEGDRMSIVLGCACCPVCMSPVVGPAEMAAKAQSVLDLSAGCPECGHGMCPSSERCWPGCGNSKTALHDVPSGKPPVTFKCKRKDCCWMGKPNRTRSGHPYCPVCRHEVTEIEPLPPDLCCFEDCTEKAVYQIVDELDQDHGCAATRACAVHVGDLLGHVVGLEFKPEEESWTVRPI